MNDKIGIDIVSIDRIKQLVNNRHNFLKRCFTDEEVRYFESKKMSPQNIASAFACKEALSKALGIGIFSFGFQNVALSHTINGKPYLTFSERGQTVMLEKGLFFSDVSITHDGGFVIAVVLLKEITTEHTEHLEEKKFRLSPRKKKSHKGNYGKVGVIGGSKGMAGAPFLTTMAALRMGAGLVYTYAPNSILNILQIKSTENIVIEIENAKDNFIMKCLDEVLEKSKMIDAMVLGPGLGTHLGTASFVQEFIRLWKKPLLLDADALNVIQDPMILQQSNISPVLTPHPLELSRLTGFPICEIEAHREEVSKKTAIKTKSVVLLKGYETVVASPSGEIYINKTGNPGMATAGSGDVLSGIIGTLLSQGYSSFEAAKMGSYFHGLAGDLAAEKVGEHGLIASDILEYIPHAIK